MFVIHYSLFVRNYAGISANSETAVPATSGAIFLTMPVRMPPGPHSIVSVTPSATAQTVLPDTGYNYLSQVTVAAIPYVETDNSAGGKTVTIG